jgi:hypothetical protein
MLQPANQHLPLACGLRRSRPVGRHAATLSWPARPRTGITGAGRAVDMPVEHAGVPVGISALPQGWNVALSTAPACSGPSQRSIAA